MKEYDYLIVGAGLFGAAFAERMTKAGKKCLVIDKRPHIAGNIYSEEVEGIQVHMYGPHIFHTDNKKVWDYVQQFAAFNHFRYEPVANYKGELYNLPFNMNTFHQMWGCKHSKRSADHLRACLKSSDKDGDESKRKNLSREKKFTFTIFPKPAEFVKPAK